MKWSVHPAKNNRTKTILSLIFVFGFLILVAIFYGAYWAILGFIILFVTLHSYFFPTYYEMSDKEIIIKTIFATQKRALKEFKKAYIGKNGILLSPFKRKTFMNRFRGVFLLLPDAREEIENYVVERLAALEAESKDNSKKNA
jgi:hypothetical protein